MGHDPRKRDSPAESGTVGSYDIIGKMSDWYLLPHSGFQCGLSSRYSILHVAVRPCPRYRARPLLHSRVRSQVHLLSIT